MKFLYTIGVASYTFAVRLASLWNPKAKKWIKGRKLVWQQLQEFIPKENVYWFHCASLGEFEQGRPLIERLKKRDAACQIVITFFSPSGYDIRKNYELADLVTYLPIDSQKNARRFVQQVSPTAVFFIKYEFWANYIFYCRDNKVPIYSVAALFRKNQIFFKAYGGFMRSVLKAFDQIFVQDDRSKKLLETINVDSKVCGDTRFDRVMENAKKVMEYPEVENFKGDNPVLICGSIWPDDLEVIREGITNLKGWKIIVAPHEISENFISQIERKIGHSSIRYSRIDEFTDESLLIIDNIGILMNLYQYGEIAYIGGGFKTGLHNILEPAAFGLPVIFGDKTAKFPEAQLFVDKGVGFDTSNGIEGSPEFTQVVLCEPVF